MFVLRRLGNWCLVQVKPSHPLAELIAKLLHGVETIPRKQMKSSHMRACREAAKWHGEQVSRFERWVYDMEKHLLATEGMCPECGCWIASTGHKEDCDVFLLVSQTQQKMKETREKNNEDSIA